MSNTSTLAISEPLLHANLLAIQQVLATAASPVTALLAVIKANGYGHGATIVAPMLAHAGVPWLGVTDAYEGVDVRTAVGSDTPEILIMLGPPGDPSTAREAAILAVQHRLTPVVWTPTQLSPIAEAASPERPHPIHLEIDTGMSRQGVPPGPALETILQAIAGEPRLCLDGVFTHLASAECAEAHQTTLQMAAFATAIEAVRQSGLKPRWLHLGNTSTIDNASPAAAPLHHLHTLAESLDARPMARSGLALFGLALPVEASNPNQAVEASRLRPTLHPVLTWRTTVTSIEDIATGAQVGYSATYTAPHPMRLAIIPVGYADGLRRALSSTNTQPGGWVMIEKQRAPIIGRISMNLTTVDITHIHPTPKPGTPVTLLGDGITAEDHARLANALPYEILCGLRVPSSLHTDN